jgi:hypothetical protein
VSVLKPFPAERLLSETDETIGITLQAYWMGFQAEKRGIDPRRLSLDLRHIAERIVEATQALETDSIATSNLVKALNLACHGEWARAGKIARELLIDASFQAKLQELADAGASYLKRQRISAEKGVKIRREVSEAQRLEWGTIGRQLREKHPEWSNSELARQIVKHLTVKIPVNTIRVSIPELGLSKAPPKT